MGKITALTQLRKFALQSKGYSAKKIADLYEAILAIAEELEAVRNLAQQAKESADAVRVVIPSIPSQNGTLTYTGENQSPVWNNYNPDTMTVSGVTSSVNAGTFEAIFTPKAGYKWPDDSIDSKTVSWSINKAAGSLSLSKNSVSFSHSVKTDSITVTRLGDGVITAISSNSSIATVSVSGTTVTINSAGQTNGDAVITISVAEGTNHLAPASLTVSVNAVYTITIEVPSQSGTLTYTGENQSPAWNNYNPDTVTVSGVTNSVNAGTFEAIFTPKAGYVWPGGSADSKTIFWSINKATGSSSLSKNSVSFSHSVKTDSVIVTRSGDGVITAVSNNTSIATVSVSETTVTINSAGQTSGNAVITISVAEGTNHLAPASLTVSVNAVYLVTIETPSQNGSLTYNGQAQTPSWHNYNPDAVTVSGVTSSINAGTFVAVFTPKAGYAWKDQSTQSKNISWTMAKAPGSLSLDKTSVKFRSNESAVVTVSRAGDGVITAICNKADSVDADRAGLNASVSGDKITITAGWSGGGTLYVGDVIVSVAEGTNHLAPEDVKVEVRTTMPMII